MAFFLVLIHLFKQVIKGLWSVQNTLLKSFAKIILTQSDLIISILDYFSLLQQEADSAYYEAIIRHLFKLQKQKISDSKRNKNGWMGIFYSCLEFMGEVETQMRWGGGLIMQEQLQYRAILVITIRHVFKQFVEAQHY